MTRLMTGAQYDARQAMRRTLTEPAPYVAGLVSLKDIFAPMAKPAKYRNQKIERNGLMFDSRRELKEWMELETMQRCGVISDLQRQVKYVLIPSQTRDDGTKERPVTYTADFTYVQAGKTVVADAKGIHTQQGIIRRKLMLMVHGITVKEV